MSAERSDSVLLFMHIPKTAGTSVRSAMTRVFDPQRLALIYAPGSLDGAMTVGDIAALTDAERREIDLLFGHFFFGIHTLFSRSSRYVTIFREPVDRVISLFLHYQERDPDRLSGRDMATWIDTSAEADNGMVRLIYGNPNIPRGKCTREMLAVAIDRLNTHFADVLLQENMGAAATRLSRLVGQQLPTLGRENVAKSSAFVDGPMRQHIVDANELDIELYEYAKRQFAGS